MKDINEVAGIKTVIFVPKRPAKSIKPDQHNTALLDIESKTIPIIENPPGEKNYMERNPDISQSSPMEVNQANTHNVLSEAMAKVDAIRDKALALGWTEEGLYQTKGRFKFPCGQDYGLVCFLDKDESIGAVTKQYIETIRPFGVRQRFYNRDVSQPWIKKAINTN